MNRDYKIGDAVLGNWTLVKLLGEGAYGKVYEAHREEYKRHISLQSRSLRFLQIRVR